MPAYEFFNSEALIPFRDFDSRELAARLQELVRNNGSYLSEQGQMGPLEPIINYSGRLALQSVESGQAATDNGDPSHFAIVRRDAEWQTKPLIDCVCGEAAYRLGPPHWQPRWLSAAMRRIIWRDQTLPDYPEELDLSAYRYTLAVWRDLATEAGQRRFPIAYRLLIHHLQKLDPAARMWTALRAGRPHTQAHRAAEAADMYRVATGWFKDFRPYWGVSSYYHLYVATSPTGGDAT